MSRTYRYSSKFSDSASRSEIDRIRERIEKRKQQRRKKIRTDPRFKKFISFRDKERARV